MTGGSPHKGPVMRRAFLGQCRHQDTFMFMLTLEDLVSSFEKLAIIKGQRYFNDGVFKCAVTPVPADAVVMLGGRASVGAMLSKAGSRIHTGPYFKYS